MFTQEEKICLAISLIMIIIVGVFGNVLVIMATVKYSRLRRNISNYLLLNLAVSDVLCSSVIMPYHLATVLDVGIISNNSVLCKVGGILSYPITLTSTLNLVMLAIDRYIATSDPLRYRCKVTFRTICIMVAYTWLHSLFFTIAIVLMANIEYDQLSLDCGVSWEKAPMWFSGICMMVNVVLPFLFVALTSLRVLSIAKSHHNKITTEIQSLSRETRTRAKRREAKATVIILMVILMFLITWSPYLITRTLRVFGVELPSIVYTASIWILHINAVGNFLIYSRRGQEYRQAFLAILRRQSVLPPSSEHSMSFR